MLKNIIKDCMESYYEMQLISDKFENKERTYKTFFNVLDNEYVITINKNIPSLNRYSKGFIYTTSVYINKDTDVVRCLNTIKIPFSRDEYNFIIPQLIKKVRSLGIQDVNILDACANSVYFEDGLFRNIEITLEKQDHDSLTEKIYNFLNVVNLYNENVYDKLKKKYTIRKETYYERHKIKN